ncbi:hypothetical protein QEN19_001559 [Hanseniaspora menglaensis]
MLSRACTKTLLKSTLKTQPIAAKILTKPFTAQALRTFSAAPVRLNKDSETSKLVEILKEEIQVELEEPEVTTIPEKLAEYDGFSIVKNDINSVNLHLIKDKGDEEIHVFIDVDELINGPDVLDQGVEGEEAVAEGEEFEPMEDLSPAKIQFAVIDKNKNTALSFGINPDFTTGDFTVQNILPFSDTSLLLSEKADDFLKKDLSYAGPQFSNLDENLQHALLQYLHSRGLNVEFVEYIQDLATHLENQKYINWLDSLQKFFK